MFLQFLSSIGIILFQAEEAQRKLKRQNREDTGISLREDGRNYLSNRILSWNFKTNVLFLG